MSEHHLHPAPQDTASFQTAAQLFKYLSDPTRVRLFFILCHSEKCVIQLSECMEMSSPALSHHLRPLRAAGLIVSRREGKEVYYRAADTVSAAFPQDDRAGAKSRVQGKKKRWGFAPNLSRNLRFRHFPYR
ncbi:MAG: ArsR/SmtB family transcription factor [Christensenellales bacterium]